MFLRRDALALGYSDRGLARAVRARAIHRVRHGAYVFADQWQRLDEKGRHLLRAMAVLRTAHSAVALSHVTALLMMGVPIWDLPLDDVHLTRVDGRAGRRHAGVAQHRGLVRPGDICDWGDVAITSPARTAIDITRVADVEHSLVVMDHLLHLGVVTKPELRDQSQAMRFSPDTLTTDLVIRLADGRLESVGESRSNYMFWRGGLPKPKPQLEIFDRWGGIVARVDFAWPEYGVFLEFDGKNKYEKLRKPGESVLDVVLREKKREELICRLTGWRCIRIVWADLYRPEATIAYIRDVLAGGSVH